MRSLILAILFFPTLSLAFRLDPMVVNIPVSGLVGSGTYFVENNTNDKVALQFEVRERVIDSRGVETRPEAKGFLIYPEQISLNAGEKRSVRVSWTGENKLDYERAYRFIASQLPIDFKNKEQNNKQNVKLKFLIEYVASLYLVPPGVKPKMKVLRKKITKNSLEIELSNEGTAHQLLEHLDISLNSAGKMIKLTDKALEEARTENILANSKRVLHIPLKENKNVTSVDIDFGP